MLSFILGGISSVAHEKQIMIFWSCLAARNTVALLWLSCLSVKSAHTDTKQVLARHGHQCSRTTGCHNGWTTAQTLLQSGLRVQLGYSFEFLLGYNLITFIAKINMSDVFTHRVSM